MSSINETSKQLVCSPETEFLADEDGIYRGENAKSVLKHLLTEIPYKPSICKYILKYEPGIPLWSILPQAQGNYISHKYPNAQGYFLVAQSHKWIAFDNSANECYVEEFDTAVLAEKWLKSEFDLI